MTDIATLQVKIETNEAQIRGLQSDLDKLGTKAKQTEGQFGKLAKRAKILGAVIVTAAVYKAIAQWTEFSAALSDLSAITGATGKDLNYLSDQSLAMGASTTLSATQAATAFKLIASAKPDLLANVEALASVTRETVALAEASGVDLTVAANTVGSSLNQFSADAEEAARFVNVLAAGAKYGASEVGQTGEAMRLAGVVAANANLSFEDTNTSLQLMAKGAIKGSEAGTGLRGVILKLSTQANDDFNPAIVGMEQALKNLADAELTATEKKKLFGQESITSAELLIKEADNFAALKTQISDTGTAYDQARVRNDNLAGDLKRLSSVTEATGITFGKTFDPALRASTQLLTDLVGGIRDAVEWVSDLGDTLGFIAASIGAEISGNQQLLDQIGQLRLARNQEKEQRKKDLEDGTTAERIASEEAAKIAEAKKLRLQEEAALEQKRVQTKIANDARIAELASLKAAEEDLAVSERGAEQLLALETSLLTQEQRLTQSYENRQFMVEEAFQNELISEQRRKELLLGLEEQHQKQVSDLVKRESDSRRQTAQRSFGAIAGIFDGLVDLMTSSGKKQTAATRTLARLSIVASTAQAVMNALAVSPYPLGVSLAVGAALKGAAQLRNVGGTGGGNIVRPSQISTPTNTSPISPPPNADAYGPQGSNRSGATTTFQLVGQDTDTVTNAQVSSMFIKMREAFERGDEVLFSADSRQALELRA